MTIKKLIEVRSQIKSSKPTFTRRHALRQFSKLKKSGWRAPKGMGNKQRRGRRGQPIKPSSGFGSPRLVKGLNKNGFEEIVVNNIPQIEKIDFKIAVAVIGATVGAKKKLEILNFAKKNKILISNVKDIDLTIKTLTKVKAVSKKEKAVDKKAKPKVKSVDKKEKSEVKSAKKTDEVNKK